MQPSCRARRYSFIAIPGWDLEVFPVPSSPITIFPVSPMNSAAWTLFFSSFLPLSPHNTNPIYRVSGCINNLMLNSQQSLPACSSTFLLLHPVSELTLAPHKTGMRMLCPDTMVRWNRKTPRLSTLTVSLENGMNPRQNVILSLWAKKGRKQSNPVLGTDE